MSLLVILLFSCTETEKTKNIGNATLVGTWKIVKTVSVYIDNSEEEYIHLPSECFSSSLFVYNNDGTLNYNRVLENEKTGDCYEKPKDYWTGTWSRKDDGNYILNHTIKYSEKDIVRQWDSTNTFTFSNNNKTLLVYDDYEKSGTSFPNEIIKAQYAVFEKIDDN